MGNHGSDHRRKLWLRARRNTSAGGHEVLDRNTARLRAGVAAARYPPRRGGGVRVRPSTGGSGRALSLMLCNNRVSGLLGGKGYTECQLMF